MARPTGGSRVRPGFAAAGVAALVVGCGGGSQQTFSGADADRLTAIRPMTPGWSWPRQPVSSRPFERDASGSTDGYLGAAENRWEDKTKLAHVDANVFRTASAAHAAMPGFRAFARKWAKRDGGRLTDVRVRGLGEEAWR